MSVISLGLMKKYGDAYTFDGTRWRYTSSGAPVPDASIWVDERTGETEMSAPEMLAHQMIDIYDISEMLGVEPESVSRMMHRGEMPEPQHRAGKHGAMWTRPVIEHWITTRPGRGANFRRAS